ncbi:MAG TPA: hypothetical protein VFG30_20285 [Polyangiales bacterium]|jgi:hypothetical protein|nr:hypothetical protein [Polyangiales bacterium]
MLMRREHERMSGAASAVLGGVFVIAGLAHATDGFTDNVARALPSAILGIIAGVALLVAAFGLLSNRYWGWKAGVGAHIVGIVIVLIGLFSLMAGYGDDRPSLAIPSVMLVLLVLSFVALWRSRPRNPIRRMQHEVAAKLY